MAVDLQPGAIFDPKVHDAVSQQESDTFEEGQIIRVTRKGYKMGDRLVRPANVVVVQAPVVESEEVSEEATSE